MCFQIAIDGFSGTGKSTVAKEISKKLNFIHIDTGALYRGIALYCVENNIDLNNEIDVVNAADSLNLDFKNVDGDLLLFLNNRDVSKKIRTQQIGDVASKNIGLIKPIRKKIVDIARNISNGKNVVMDGRDIGSVVLPDANLKIFLHTNIDIKTNRRLLELKELGENPAKDDVKRLLSERDIRDSTRKIDPTVKLPDAISIDTSYMTKAEVISKIISLVTAKQIKIDFKELK